MKQITAVNIDLNALKHNLERIRQLAPNKAVIAMVKGNAYGHGMIAVAQTLAPHVNALGVARISEAQALREAGLNGKIVCFGGFQSSDELVWMSAQQIDVVVWATHQVDLIRKTSLKKPIQIWIKVDTGMHRLGFSPDQVQGAYQALQACPQVLKPLGWMSHFAKADEWQDNFTLTQHHTFLSTVASFPGPQSLANSAAIIKWPQTHLDWVRPGIMLYGISPFADISSESLQLKPVMRFHSCLISVLALQRGDRIGYGGTWACPQDMRVGVVAAGYGDGYPRHAPSGTPVWVDGVLCPIVGRVSMDLITVDLRGAPKARIGSQVVLWGPELPVETIAANVGTIGYELVTKITSRVVLT